MCPLLSTKPMTITFDPETLISLISCHFAFGNCQIVSKYASDHINVTAALHVAKQLPDAFVSLSSLFCLMDFSNARKRDS